MQMFTSLEVRPVQNGFLVTVNEGENEKEYIFDSSRKLVRHLKELIELQRPEKGNDR